MNKTRKSLGTLMREAASGLEFEVETAKLEFTEDILSIMEQKGITRSRLAQLLGVEPPRVTALLRGDNNFRLETMIRICRALGVKYQHRIERPDNAVRWINFFPRGFSAKGTVAPSNVVPFPSMNAAQSGFSPVYQEDFRELAIAT